MQKEQQNDLKRDGFQDSRNSGTYEQRVFRQEASTSALATNFALAEGNVARSGQHLLTGVVDWTSLLRNMVPSLCIGSTSKLASLAKGPRTNRRRP
eukprot:1781193-Amphidinium_carterae.1